jgi:DNA-binding transcriptional MocR family regulator
VGQGDHGAPILRLWARAVTAPCRRGSTPAAQSEAAAARATRPDGGYFLWVELPREVSALELHRRAMANGISIAPGPIFSGRRKCDNYVRLNYGHAWSPRLEQAMAKLGNIAASLMSEGKSRQAARAS